MKRAAVYIGMISILTFFSLTCLDSAYAGRWGKGEGDAERKSTWTGANGETKTREAKGVWDPETKTWKKKVTKKGTKGNAVTTEVQGATSENGYIRNSAVTGPNGETATRSAMGVWDPETKTWKKNVTNTGAEGKTVDRETEFVKTEDGYTRNTTITGPDGATSTSSATAVWDPETKSWTKEVTATGAQGNTVTTQVQGTKTEDGYIRNSATTGPDGETVTRGAMGIWDPETKTWTRGGTTTGPQGKSVSDLSQVSVTDDGYTRNSAVAGPDGSAAARSASGVWDPETKTWTKGTVTVGPQGNTATSQSNITVTGEEQGDTAVNPEEPAQE